jgi:2-polyprenyl-3-methyl-5-hydroxy-6-metoxy-1,4-benzoquinol methylase
MPTATQIRLWYNRRYAALGAASMRPYEAYPPVLDLLEVRSGARLLDVSCGTGFLLRAAGAKGLHATGVDLSDEAVRVARKTAPAAVQAVASGEALCLRDGSFDYVTCLGSLEHFLDMSKGLEEFRRVARPGATLCIMVPNRDFLGWKLGREAGTAQQDISEHLHSLEEWRTLFVAHGLLEIRVVADPWQAVRLRGAAKGGIRGLVNWLVGALWPLIPLRYEYQFIFLLRSAP